MWGTQLSGRETGQKKGAFDVPSADAPKTLDIGSMNPSSHGWIVNQFFFEMQALFYLFSGAGFSVEIASSTFSLAAFASAPQSIWEGISRTLSTPFLKSRAVSSWLIAC